MSVQTSKSRGCRAVVLLALLVLTTLGYAQQPSPAHPLDAILNPDGSLKLGKGLEGSFRADGYRMELGPKGEPKFIPSVAQTYPAISSDTADIHWDSRFPTPTGFDAPVRTIYVDGGSVYFGGDFTVVGSTPANGVAKWDGTSWSSLGSGVVGTVYAISKFHGDIYVAGYIFRAGGIAVNCIARWDGTSWSPLGIPPNDGLNNYVYALLTMRDSLYILGGFSWPSSDTTVKGLAIWDGTSMIPMPGDKAAPYFPQCLATDGKNLYVGGGGFTLQSGGIVRYARGVGRWDGTSWDLLGTPAYNGVRGWVYCMTYANGSLYVGGMFDSAGGTVSASNVARWNGTTWSSLGAGLNKDVNALTFLNGKLYAGGIFSASGIDTMNGFASYDTTVGAWTLVSPGVAPLGSTVLALDHSTSAVFLGGNFGYWSNSYGNGGGDSYYAASWSNGTYAPVGVASFADGVSGYGRGNGVDQWLWQQVNAIVVSGPLVYVGGNFTFAGSTKANNIACWNTVTKTWSPLGRGLNGFVTAMVANGSELYAGGMFDSAGQTAAHNVARWDGASWHALGIPPNDGVSAYVFSLLMYSGDLYVGGIFSAAGGASMNNIARWDGTSWYPLSSGIVGGIYAMAVYGDELYAGGPIAQAGGVTVKNLARWDGVSWKAVGTAPDDGVDAPIYVLTAYGGDLYAGGTFTKAGVTSANSIARWNGSSWSALGPGLNGIVRTITPAGASVYVGGDFTGSGVRNVRRIARWDTSTSTWSTLGSGINREVFSIGALGDDLYVGGQLTVAGAKASVHIARWNSTFVASGVRVPQNSPVAFALEQNYPNPFNPSTRIRFSIPERSEYAVGSMETKLVVYDLLGREVAVLVNEKKAPGNYEVTFDASGLASGMYLYRLQAGSSVETRKLILLR